MTTFTARVSTHQLLAGSFQYLGLELTEPNRIQFQAGQYVIMTIDPQEGVRRNYSISSQPSKNHGIELLVDVKPQGPGSAYLRSLKPGDAVEFTGPFGNFTVESACAPPGQTHHQLLFGATGSGISPVRSLILDLLKDKHYQGPVRLWWGMRQAQDCFWVEDLDLLQEEYPTFSWDLVLSQPPPDWPLHSGYITDHLVRYAESALSTGQDNPCVHLCGNHFMIEDVSTKLAALGITRDHIHTEKFF